MLRPWSCSFGNKPHVCLSGMERVRKWDEVVRLAGSGEGIDSGLWAGCQAAWLQLLYLGSTTDPSTEGC